MPVPAAPWRRPARPRPLAHAREGQTMIIVMLAFVVLVGCVALGVDGARLYAEGLRVQKAADEAALNAVTQVGDGSDRNGLQNLVTSLVSRNLPLANGASVSATPTLTGGATNQLRVVVTETGFPLSFASVLGFKVATITREATAQYNAPVPMGNPTGTLGDPGGADGQVQVYQPNSGGTADQGTAATVQQNMKLSINGPDTLVENGDPYSPLYVLSDPPFASNAQITNPFRAHTNPAFDGYDYKVTINSNGYTYIQVYDAETCGGTSSSTGYRGPFNDLTVGGGFGVPSPVNSPAYHYSANYATFYSLYKYDGTTNTRTPAAPSTSVTLGKELGLDSAYGPPVVIAPTEESGPGCTNSDPGTKPFTSRWYTLAKINGAPGDTYIVNVSTCLNGIAGTPTPPPCSGDELNNFVLRAVTTTGTGSLSCFASDLSGSGSDPGNTCQTMTQFRAAGLATNQPTIAGMGRISVEVNDPGSTGKTFIYLAQIAQIYKGKWLLVKLFDPGDVMKASSIQIVRPDGTYAPFMWYTQTLDGSGNTFTTPMQGNVTGSSGNLLNKSLITSLNDGGECPIVAVGSPTCSSPTYSTITAPGQCNQPTSDPTGPGSIAPAYGQTMAEDNPFDPAQVTCFGASPKSWNSPSSAFPPDTSYGTDTHSTHYYDYNYSTIDGHHYQPFNGRWVYMFTQIPSNYDDGSSLTSGPYQNPYPGWWYVQYSYTPGVSSFVDRTTWEASIIDTPPHLIN